MDKPKFQPNEVNRLIDQEVSRIEARNNPVPPAQPASPFGMNSKWMSRIASITTIISLISVIRSLFRPSRP